MEKYIDVFKALADTTRLKIIKLLLTHDLCVGAIASCLDISSAAVSQHLQVLRRVGIVRGEKRGYWTHYSVRKDVLLRIADDFKDMVTKPASHNSELNIKVERIIKNCPSKRRSARKSGDY